MGKHLSERLEKAIKSLFKKASGNTKRGGIKPMKNRIAKNGNDYKIIRENDDGSNTVIAILKKEKNGYTKTIYNEYTKTWITPRYFSFFPTLKAAKRFFEIS